MVDSLNVKGRKPMFWHWLINFALSYILNSLWSLVNALQLMVNLPLVNVGLPLNAYITSLTLSNIASFDVMPT